MTRRPTYGDLVQAACEEAAGAAVELVMCPLSGRIAAREAVAAYRALLGAIHAHVKALSLHRDWFDVEAASAAGDPCAAAVAQLVRDLSSFAHLPGLVRYTAEGPGTDWGGATTSLRSATDLLVMRHNLCGTFRSPDSVQLEEPAQRAAALAAIGDLTSTVLGAERDLAQRAGQAGIAREDLDRLLPDLEPSNAPCVTLTAANKPG